MVVRSDKDAPTAMLLTQHAHELRNQIATLRSVRQLIDDAEIVAALNAATSTLQTFLERAVASARIELTPVHEFEEHDLMGLLALARKRAKREEVAVGEDANADANSRIVHVPGKLMERLLTDLVHIGGGAYSLALGSTSTASITVAIADRTDSVALAPYLRRLAGACNCELALDSDEAVLRIPLRG